MPRECRMTLERWRALMRAWGFNDNAATFDALATAYNERGRHYHTIGHVSACLRHLDVFVSKLDAPREVEIALWFHDAVYKPWSSRNERDSADWAASFLIENGASEEDAARVEALIMVTEHQAPTKTRDQAALVDIDLSILGADPDTYELFEQGIRKEYWFVPSFLYRKKRAEILKGFLDRPRIFTAGLFPDEAEHQARQNLTAALTRLKGTP